MKISKSKDVTANPKSSPRNNLQSPELSTMNYYPPQAERVVSDASSPQVDAYFRFNDELREIGLVRATVV
jgi:hypothetical protein